MDKKAFFDNVKKEANITLTKIFDKVEEISKTSALQLNIGNLKSQITDCQKEIGRFVYNNKAEFASYPEIQEQIDKIVRFEEEIEAKKEQITNLKKKEDKTEQGKEEESNSFSL